MVLTVGRLPRTARSKSAARTETAVAPVSPDEPLLRVRGIGMRYGPVRALDGVDLDIRAGEVVALAGENGAGKSTLVRAIAGDLVADSGTVEVAGKRLTDKSRAAARAGIAVVWQDLALCDNLDVAANLMLGRERSRLLMSDARSHAAARDLLGELGIPLVDTAQTAGTLSGGQRQMLAVARAMRDEPRLLILDEPTAALGVREAAQVEDLAFNLRRKGTTILLVSHDIEQMFRLADRIVVLRHGRVVGDVHAATAHPDDVIAMISGQEVDSSARHQLSRLQSLVDQLALAEPASGLPLIVSAMAAALGADRLCIHLVENATLRLAGSLGIPAPLLGAWQTLPWGERGGPMGLAAARDALTVDVDVHDSPAWAPFLALAGDARVASSWSLPFSGSQGLTGVVTVLGPSPGRPARDEIDLVSLYAGYAATALERDALLGELTSRNRFLETIREVLETLAGPVPLADGLTVALAALRAGLQADEVSLLDLHADGTLVSRVRVPAVDGEPEDADLGAARMLSAGRRDGEARHWAGPHGATQLGVTFAAPAGPAVLVARWERGTQPAGARALIEDAAHSLRLALEREASEAAQQETTALRRTQELQQQFLSQLSHELRTPLTGIRGFASSLMQRDVTWDVDSQQRFVGRIVDEAGRLSRLVDDLLDFSAIEASLMRLAPDWCDMALILDAARTCLPAEAAARVRLIVDPTLPVVWADHDRIEQILVNLMDNATRHNPPGTQVLVRAALTTPSGADPSARGISISVSDDGPGVHPDVAANPFEPRRARRSPTAGAGLGLSITKGIVDAHRGRISLRALDPGTRFLIELPVERDGTLAPALGDASTTGTGPAVRASAPDPVPTTSPPTATATATATARPTDASTSATGVRRD